MSAFPDAASAPMSATTTHSASTTHSALTSHSALKSATTTQSAPTPHSAPKSATTTNSAAHFASTTPSAPTSHSAPKHSAPKSATSTRNDDEQGNTILAGMYEFLPSKEKSELGKGAFGTVYRMRNPIDKRVFAVKQLTNLVNDDGTEDKVEMLAVKEDRGAEDGRDQVGVPRRVRELVLLGAVLLHRDGASGE